MTLPITFLATSFAIAGLVAAAGPILIHLLNRQRFRVVEWAAMDFLRQAVRRNRRILRLRDLLLLALRTLCVLAAFTNRLPYLIERAIGSGQVVFTQTVNEPCFALA
jgi:hypothetical protein